VLMTAEVIDLMLELILHMTREPVRLQVLSPFTDNYRIGLDLPLDFKSESDFTVDSRDGVEVCEGPGILHNSKICRLHGR
jgi:hypothetical protein